MRRGRRGKKGGAEVWEAGDRGAER